MERKEGKRRVKRDRGKIQGKHFVTEAGTRGRGTERQQPGGCGTGRSVIGWAAGDVGRHGRTHELPCPCPARETMRLRGCCRRVHVASCAGCWAYLSSLQMLSAGSLKMKSSIFLMNSVM